VTTLDADADADAGAHGDGNGNHDEADDARQLAQGRAVSRRRRRRQALLGYALVLPSFVIFGLFVFYPFVRNIQLGLYRTPPFPGVPAEFVGLDQYGDVLTSSYFLDSLKTTVLFFLLTVPTGIFAGLGLAVLAHQKLRGVTAYRTIFSSTVATSVAAASVIFFTLLNPQVGLFTYWLGREGQLSVLQDPDTALLAVSVATVWQNLGLAFILMSAGLQAIPDELYEAARMDGAGAWSRFRNVTIPMMSPTIFFASVVGGILAFQAFGQIDILTEGGPLNKTNVLVYAIYREVFKHNNEGVAAVFAMALFVIVALLTLFQLRFIERRVTYAR
jgi:sn-glycerol 3-phosphate transport system permease protein